MISTKSLNESLTSQSSQFSPLQRKDILSENNKPLLPLTTPHDSTLNGLNMSFPLDLKVPSTSTLSPQPKHQGSEGRASPAYSDISDDGDDDKTDKDVSEKSTPISSATSVEKSPFYPFYSPSPYMMGTPLDLDQKSGSPSELGKKMIPGPFPPFYFPPVQGPRPGSSGEPLPGFPGLQGENVPSQRMGEADGKINLLEGKNTQQRPKESGEPRNEKLDLKCKSPLLKDSSTSKPSQVRTLVTKLARQNFPNYLCC